INAGDNTDAPAADQRGFPRIVAGRIDIGAYEYDNNPPAITCSAGITNCVPPGVDVGLTFSATVSDPDGDQLLVLWSVDGVPIQTNIVAASGPPMTAQVPFIAFITPGTHLVTASVSDPDQCA